MQCSISRISAEAAGGRSDSAAWAFAINCTEERGVSSWYSTAPVFSNGVCFYRFKPIAPLSQRTGERIVESATIFDRAVIANAAPCPSVISGKYTNLWKVEAETFRVISGLDYKTRLRSQGIDSDIVHFDRVFFVRKDLDCDQYQVNAKASDGALYAVSVCLYRSGKYRISSVGKLER